MTGPSIPLGQRGSMMRYLTDCRVAVEGGSVVVQQKAGTTWVTESNIPRENLALLVMGHGTSLTHEAACLLGDANTVVMFARSDGCSPKIATPTFQVSMAHYPPASYLQEWSRKWHDADWRLRAGKLLLSRRVDLTANYWSKADWPSKYEGCTLDEVAEARGKKRFKENAQDNISKCASVPELLGWEGVWVKDLRNILFDVYRLPPVERDYTGKDTLNRSLNSGHQLAYGLAATAMHGLGLPPGMGLIHGTTNRGALVFDLADPLKDAIVLPCCVKMVADGKTEKEIHKAVITKLTEHRYKALTTCFDLAKDLAVSP